MRFLSDTLKRLWIIFWGVLPTLIFFLPVTISALFSSTGNLAFDLSRVWAKIMLRATRTRAQIRNKDRIKSGRSYVIVANHQSSPDIFSIVTSLDVQFRWTIKKSRLWIPLFGYALYASKNIFIDRSSRTQAIQSINKGVGRLPPGAGLMFFVEETRSKDEKLKKFKKGAFITAIQNNFPVLPITINGSGRLMPKGTILFRPGTVELIVGDPIDTKSRGIESLEELIEQTQEDIRSKLRC